MSRPHLPRDSIGATLRARSDPLFDLDALPRIVEIDIERIEAHPEQPRKRVDQTALAELAQSIERHGLLQPIVVQSLGANGYVLVAGQRRLLAHRQLGRTRIAALLASGDRDELALIENLQRENLEPLDEAEALAALKERHGYNQDELAKALAKAKSTISELLSLNSLAEAVKTAVRDQPRTVTKSVLIEIARLPDENAQLAFWERVRAGSTVREARAVKSGSPVKRDARQPCETIRRQSQRLLRGLDDVALGTLQADAELISILQTLRRRLGEIIDD